MVGENDERISRVAAERDQETVRNENSEASRRGTDSDGHFEPGEVQQRGTEPAEDAEPAKIVRGSKFDEKRQRIAELARANRERDDDFEVVMPGRVSERIETPEDRRNARDEQPEEVKAEQPAEKPAAVKHKLKVNGREVELDEADVIAHAQKAMAAEGIMEDAKSKRDEAYRLLEMVKNARENQPPSDADPEEKKAPKAALPKGVDLSKLVEDIQVGDPEQAQAALEQYGDAIEERILSQIRNHDQTIETQVDEVLAGRRRREQTESTLTAFAEANPDIAESRTLQAGLAQGAADTMRHHMREIGVRDDTIDNLMKKRGMNEVQATAFSYRTLQDQGFALPSHDKVLEEAAGKLRKEFGLADPKREQPSTPSAGFVEERQERKRMMAPQPRRAAVASGLENRGSTIDENRAAAVQKMRLHRRGRA